MPRVQPPGPSTSAAASSAAATAGDAFPHQLSALLRIASAAARAVGGAHGAKAGAEPWDAGELSELLVAVARCASVAAGAARRRRPRLWSLCRRCWYA